MLALKLLHIVEPMLCFFPPELVQVFEIVSRLLQLNFKLVDCISKLFLGLLSLFLELVVFDDSMVDGFQL